MITKERRIQVRATRSQVAAWLLCAEESGLSLSEWLRRCAEQRIAASARGTFPPIAESAR
jgi:hypothetical protein